MDLKGVTDKVRRYPLKFILIIFGAIAYLTAYRIWEIEDWRILTLLLLLALGMGWIIFSRSVNDTDLMMALDRETKKLDAPIESIYHITGCNRYEVNLNEEGQYIYWISDANKKKVLKRLREVNHG